MSPVEAISAASSTHKVGDLARHGIRKVRLLSESHLRDALRVAVNRAILSLLDDLQLPEDALRRLRERAESEFRALVEEGLEASDRDPQGAGSATLASTPRHPAPHAAGGGLPGPDGAGVPEEFRTFEQRMLRDLTSLIERDWKSDLQSVRDSQGKKLDMIERRISKLVLAIESTDRLLAHMQHGRRTAREGYGAGISPSIPPHLDPAAPLDVESPLHEKKQELLQALFQANLKLKELEGSADRDGQENQGGASAVGAGEEEHE
ncbi:MAG: hypothetical protein ACE5GW_01580 [Planctomycetota bacterium]